MFLVRGQRLVSKCDASGVGFSFLGPKTKCYLGLIVWGWEDNIKRNLKETVRQDEDWLHLSQDGDKWRTVADTVIKLLLLQKAVTF